jgi:hypothetical protein
MCGRLAVETGRRETLKDRRRPFHRVFEQATRSGFGGWRIPTAWLDEASSEAEVLVT